VAIYWTLKHIPELDGLPSKLRGEAWRRVSRKTYRHWQTWVGLLACGACSASGTYLGNQIGSGLVGAMLGGALGGFLFGQVSIYVGRRYYRDILRGKSTGLSVDA